jgi:hypothetical protein
MASPSPESFFSIIDGARIEGRLENVLQRKKELQTLYTAIQYYQTPLIEALNKGEKLIPYVQNNPS